LRSTAARASQAAPSLRRLSPRRLTPAGLWAKGSGGGIARRLAPWGARAVAVGGTADDLASLAQETGPETIVAELADPIAAREAAEQAGPYRDAGYEPRDMAAFAMSDEPGWYYPQQLDALKKDADALARFRKYLETQGLKPADVGATRPTVLPSGAEPGRVWVMRMA